MKLIKQNDYPHIPYITNTSKRFDEDGTKTTIADSGCGICAAMMLMEYYYPEIEFTMNKAIELSYECEANHGLGTDYKRYSEALCQKYGLKLERTDKKDVLIKHLNSGNIAVVNVGGNHDDYLGYFSKYGHYIVVESIKEDVIKVLDPGYTSTKYLEAHRIDKMKVIDERIYASIDLLMEDIKTRKYPIYMYQRKSK